MSATPTINIGLCKQGTALVKSIDHHFSLHEVKLYDSILSSSINLKEDTYSFEMSNSDGAFKGTNVETIKVWFENFLYPEINNLGEVSQGSSDHITIVNIVFQIEDTNVVDVLKDLLDSIQELKKSQLVGVLSLRLFVLIHPGNKKNTNLNKEIAKHLETLKTVNEEFDDLLHDIYYIDNQNVDNFHLNLDTKWLGFALGEFFVLQMIGPTSMARTSKNKIFGLGVVHFNEVLFRELVSNKILGYKFEEEGIDDTAGVQQQDIFNQCNPFIKKHQDFFKKFFEQYPFSEDNDEIIETNTKKYISEFDTDLNSFVTDKQYKIGVSKAILANLIGEDDEKLEGVNWNGERLNLKDLEFDIVDYFNEFVEKEDKVELKKEKELRERITDLKNGIKKDKRILKKINEKSVDINSDLDISFEEGVFSVDGKRINASGYIPSKIGPEDEFYSFNDDVIPERMDLSAYFGNVKDQGQLGSCTAFPIAAVYEFAAIQNKNKVDVSELFVYYNSRVLRGNVHEDTGVSLLDAVNSVKEHGACFSETYPYEIENFKNEPNENSFIEAKHQVVEKAYRVAIKEKDFKQAIAKGHPVIFGLKLFESFYPKDKSGLITYPTAKEASHKNHGHHAMLLVGYNDDEKLFKVRNSWGKTFGNEGYCFIPYDYVTNASFCTEAFVITEIVDLSYSEFAYKTSVSFSFLKDALIRKKNITEYRLRDRVRLLSEIKKEFDIVVLLNDENTERIKDSIFRKNILRELESRTPQPLSVQASETPIKKKSSNQWYYLILGGVLLTILAFFLGFLITPIGSIILGFIGLGILGFALWKIFQETKKVKVQKPSPNPKPTSSNSLFGARDVYAFKVADRLFDQFDEMDKDLITRYRALSKYFNKVKQWKDEISENLNTVDFNSPKFVFNLVEKKPLMDYLAKEKDNFLLQLPHLSALFHEKYAPEENNIDEVFGVLKKDYLKDIQENTNNILSVSIVDYLLGEKYPYFNLAPDLSKTIPKLEGVSKPFCNLKTSSTDIKTQHYVLLEKIKSNRSHKHKEFAIHRNADITPVIVEREGKSEKFVSIQVAAINSMDNLVRFCKE